MRLAASAAQREAARMLIRSTICAEMSDMNAIVMGSRSQKSVSLFGARW